jgi:dihydroxyacetone kinase-like predicted kinase
MNLSMTSGATAVVNSASDKVGELANVLAKGLLMGARGRIDIFCINLQTFSASLNHFLELTRADFCYLHLLSPP